MDQSPTQRLAGLLLGEPLSDFVEQRRSQGVSWRLIARDLYERTGGEIDVTPQTLRIWHSPADDSATAKAAS